MTSLGRFYQDIFEQHHDDAWDRAPGKDVFVHALEHLIAAPKPGGDQRLIDIGCGTGFLLARIADEVHLPWDLYGVDFAPAAIARGQSRYPNLHLSCEDGSATHFVSESFDAVISYGAMEHFPDPQAAIREATRLLAPGGLFLIMLPTLGAYRQDRDDEGWYEDLTGQPQWNLRRTTWNAFFLECGLDLWSSAESARYGAKQPDVYFLGRKPQRII